MLNTSNEQYNYVSSIIIDFLEKNRLTGGEKFNLYLEQEEHVIGQFASLEKSKPSIVSGFSYTHPESLKQYSTFSLLVNDINVIVASSTEATEDYLTTLRNRVSKQEDSFDQTAILILYSGKLDSLRGGSGSLIKEGMPLHIDTFKEQINIDLSESKSLETHEKKILSTILKKRTHSLVEDNCSIFDYESIIVCLQKEKIEQIDYPKLGLFFNNELGTKGDKIQENIDANIDIYEKFEFIFNHGSPETDLGKYISDKGIKELNVEDWQETDFGKIEQWRNAKGKKKAPEYLEVSDHNIIGSNIWGATGWGFSNKKKE